MPYTTTWEEKGIIWKYSGIISKEEVLQSNHEFYSDERSDNCKYQIVDGRDIDDLAIEYSTMKQVAAMDHAASRQINGIKVALVASDSRTSSSFTQYSAILKSLDGSWQVRVFDDMEIARAWINE